MCRFFALCCVFAACASDSATGIDVSTAGSASMPEGGDTLLEERQLLGEWLACGAP